MVSEETRGEQQEWHISNHRRILGLERNLAENSWRSPSCARLTHRSEDSAEVFHEGAVAQMIEGLDGVVNIIDDFLV